MPKGSPKPKPIKPNRKAQNNMYKKLATAVREIKKKK